MEGQYDRFKDAVWFNSRQKLLIGGAGGIGSWLSLFLTRAGFPVIVYDYDEFELHNMSGQFVKRSDINKSKVEALAENLQDFSNTTITTMNEKFTEQSSGHYFMMAAFDNMEARKAMFNVWKKLIAGFKEVPIWVNTHNRKYQNKPLFIDGRLLMEQMQIFCVTPDNMDKYEETHLFDDSEVADEACTLKQTSHSAAMIASFMTGFFTNHIGNIRTGLDAFNVPFEFEYYIPLNQMTDGDSS